MEICALASGSSGNCFYVGNGGSAVLIDAGISCKQIVERILSIGGRPENVKGIFITHEHADHVRGARVFSEKFGVPVFATEGTVHNSPLGFCENIKFIGSNETVERGGVEVEAFSKFHRSADPVSYTVSNGKRVSVITDVGCSCGNVESHVKDSDFLFIESNYDEGLLENGTYPYFLKKWISSRDGHFSNSQSALCVLEHASAKLRGVVLSHLSENNNTPEHALESFGLIRERNDLNPGVWVSGRGVSGVWGV